MQMKPLGRTGMQVSEFCLGTMTWGQQNSAEEGYARWTGQRQRHQFSQAEYPSRPTADTQGRTEEIIGEWFTRPASALTSSSRAR